MTTETLPARTFGVVLLRSPLRSIDREHSSFVEGTSIAQAIEALGLRAGARLQVLLDGREVPRERWGEVAPAAGSVLVVRLIPEAAAVFVAVFEILYALGASAATAYTVAAVAGTVVFVAEVAAFAYSAYKLVFPGAPPGALSAGTKGQNLIDGTRNRIEKYAKIPIVCGSPRYVPPQAMQPFSKSASGVTKVTQMFDFGRGPIDFRDVRIGANPIFLETTTIVYDRVMQADGSYKKIELEFRRGAADDLPITLVTDEVHEEPLSVILRSTPTGPNSASPVVRRTLPSTTRFSVDVTFPSLFWQRNSGSITSTTVLVLIRYRRVGTSTWVSTDANGKRLEIRTTAASTGVVRKTWESAAGLTAGSYDVELTRSTPSGVDAGIHDTTYWTALRSIRPGDPLHATGHARIVTRITGTSEINGAMDELSAIAERYAWNGSAYVKTRNPMAYYRLLLQDEDNRLRISDADLSKWVDTTRLSEIAAACDLERRSFDFVFDDAGTTVERLRSVCGAARASFTQRDGKFSAVRDDPAAPVAGVFTPVNSWGFRWTKAFPKLPHGLRVHYVDPLHDWKMVERIVFDEGYSETGSGGTQVGSEFDELTLTGQLDASIVWMDGKYQLAVHRERDVVYEWSTGWEYRKCEVGDRVRLSHDAISKGLSWGRITRVVSSGGNVLSIEVDQLCHMEALTAYGVCMRRGVDGASVVKALGTVPGDSQALVFVASITDPDEQPAVGDLFAFGLLGEETIEVLVTDIRPAQDHTAALTAVDVAEDVYGADQGDRPAWASGPIFGEVPPGGRDPFDGPSIAGMTSTSGSTAKLAISPPPGTGK